MLRDDDDDDGGGFFWVAPMGRESRAIGTLDLLPSAYALEHDNANN